LDAPINSRVDIFTFLSTESSTTAASNCCPDVVSA
jgi:hypothetical protein